MLQVEITPSILSGNIQIPPSKSMSHRAIFCAALAQGISLIKNVLMSKDIIATCEAMEALGCKIKYKLVNKEKDLYTLRIQGNPQLDLIKDNINCNESGSTLRFLIPLLAILEKEVTVSGRGKLVSRPIDSYYKIFDEQKIEYHNRNGELPLTIKGKLKSGTYSIEGDVSSQFITGLFFALPLLDEESKVVITSDLESRPYVDMSLEMLARFGIKIISKDYKEFIIPGNQQYKATDYTVEGDYSQGAFWLSAGLLGSEIYSNDLKSDSTQGDKAIIDILKRMDGKIEQTSLGYKPVKSKTSGITIDVSQCPDLVPILGVVGSLSYGITKIVNAKRLRIKESDRLEATTALINNLGGDITEYSDGLLIKGMKSLKGGVVDSFNDHRIAMAAAIASTRCEEQVIITNAQAVEKSYPKFWDDFIQLGGQLHEFHVGK